MSYSHSTTFSPPVAICVHCGSTDLALMRQTISNGSTQVVRWCNDCQQNASGPGIYVSHSKVRLDDLDWLTPMHNNGPCEVCGEPYTESHHWAPVEVFGPDADKWPRGWLCPKHHREWRERMMAWSMAKQGK